MNFPTFETPDDNSQRIWIMYRIDDNGNSFVVQNHLTREEAEQLLATFEARGHKQYYWIESEREGSSA